MRCEGYRRYGGAFTFGPVIWRQCENEALVVLETDQDGETQQFPACAICWNESLEAGILIISARPILIETQEGSNG